jgi:hypothetical protein
MDLCSLYRFHLVFHSRFSDLELFGSDTFPHASYADTIVTKGEGGAFGAASYGDGDPAFVLTRPFHATRC